MHPGGHVSLALRLTALDFNPQLPFVLLLEQRQDNAPFIRLRFPLFLHITRPQVSHELKGSQLAFQQNTDLRAQPSWDRYGKIAICAPKSRYRRFRGLGKKF